MRPVPLFSRAPRTPTAILTVLGFVGMLLLTGCLASPDAASTAQAGTLNKHNDPVCQGTLGGVDLRTATIAELQEALDKNKFTSVELVEAYIARIHAFDDPAGLNGVRQISPTALEYAAQMDAERKAGNVRGPMHGIPFMMKDNINTGDQQTTAGAVALTLNYPPRDATLVAKLREAGAVVLGKNELGELANWGAASNGSTAGGPQHNGYNGGSASGSSSGPGVAGSMAYGAIALGSETSGSILGPTNVNSLVGLKTSHGLVSGKGVVPIAYHFDVVGPMGRSAYDVAVTLSAMAGTDPEDPFTSEADAHLPPGGDFRTFLSTDALQGVRLGYDPESTGELFLRALDDLRAVGAELVPVEVSPAQSSAGLVEIAMLPNAFHHDFNYYLQNDADPSLPFKTLHEFHLYNQQNHRESYTPPPPLTHASALTPGERNLRDVTAEAAIRLARDAADSIFQDNGISAMVTAGPGFSSLGAAAGYPTTMVPMGYNDDRPQGLAFFGPKWSDGQLIGYAYAYEQVSHRRVPPEVFNQTLLEVAGCPLDDGRATGPPEGKGPPDDPEGRYEADVPFAERPEYARLAARILADA